MDATDTQALLAAAQGGDRAALEKLLDSEQARIFRYSMKMCGHPEDAADVLQETLLTMARSLGEFRGESSLSTWVYTIARSFCGKKRRKSKFAPEREDSLDTDVPAEAARLAHPTDDPEAATANQQVRVALDRAIGALEPMYREVLLLRDVEGLTAPEVGEVLGLSIAAVKSRLHRARSAVRESLAPMLAPEAALPGAGCPDIAASLSRHLEGELNPDACAEMERHLDACPGCKATCDTLKQTLRLCRASTAPAVPPEVASSVRAAIKDLLATRP